MREVLRVGTRTSPLALRQTLLVLEAFHRVQPGLSGVMVPFRTAGDERGGKRDFTDRIDEALERNDIDIAVHSAKDLSTQTHRSVVLAGVLPRENPRDCVLLRSTAHWRDLPRGAHIGSSSLRRRAQLLSHRPDLTIVEFRGNVGTRLHRWRQQSLDGIVLACAGLIRLGWASRITEVLSLREMLPSPGQGAIAIETRKGDSSLQQLIRLIDHVPTHASVEAERAFASALGADCSTPLGAYGHVNGTELTLRGAVFSADGRERISGRQHGSITDPAKMGRHLARELREKGVDRLLRSP